MRSPIVMIHGMWSRGEHYARMAAQLHERGHDCLMPTLPAHEEGASPEDVGALSLRDYLSFLESWIAEREFRQPPALIGHSMGGLLAQQLAARVRPFALVLLTPAPPAGILALTSSNTIAFSGMLARWGWWRRAHRFGRRRAAVSLFNQTDPARFDEFYDSLTWESGRAAFETGFWYLDRTHASAVDPARVKCPVYVVSAGQDRLTPASVVRKVAARYPGSALRHYPDRGHWVLDDPDTDDMTSEIANWLQGHEHRSAARGRA